MCRKPKNKTKQRQRQHKVGDESYSEDALARFNDHKTSDSEDEMPGLVDPDSSDNDTLRLPGVGGSTDDEMPDLVDLEDSDDSTEDPGPDYSLGAPQGCL